MAGSVCVCVKVRGEVDEDRQLGVGVRQTDKLGRETRWVYSHRKRVRMYMELLRAI